MNSKWDIYNELIAGIPSGIKVTDCVVGGVWTYIKTETLCGVALTVRQKAGYRLLDGPVNGMDLKETAALVKSWNFIEASIGMAAVNAWYNRIDHIREMGILPKEGERRKNDVFALLGPAVNRKKVTVVGHFPHIEKTLAPICDLTILERNPSEGDMPDSACEYILGEQDFVIITGMTFMNKTLPRLLELARPDAVVTLAGPSVPMCETIGRFGISNLSGFCVSEGEPIMNAIKTGHRRGIFEYGYMLDYSIPK